VLASGFVLTQPAATAPATPPTVQVAHGTGRGKAVGSPQTIRLLMTPAQARADQPDKFVRCWQAYGHRPLVTTCRFGDRRGRHRLVLLGDSQAVQWAPALDRWGRSHGWQVHVFTKASCPFNDARLWLWKYKGHYKACTRWRAEVLAYLRTQPRYDLAVLSRSRSYIPMVMKSGGGRATQEEVVSSLWLKATKRSIVKLRPVARHVVLMRATPVADTDPPACLSAHSGDITECSFARLKGIRDPLLRRERDAVDGTVDRVLDVTDDVCPDPLCPVVTVGGLIIYRDIHHLTATFAASLADELGARLQAVATT
jgi:hypothetical protein